MEREVAERRFRETIRRPESWFSLAEAALLIAAREYPDLEPERYLAWIDERAAEVAGRLPTPRAVPDVVREINRQLVTIEGFEGNTDDYEDPRNSFLNEVIDRRLGIPITLALLYVELGERLGVPVRGISFPGHFLVRFGDDDQRIVIDPFFRGAVLDDDELLARMHRFVPLEGPARGYLEHVLAGASKAEVVARVLRNLKEIYAGRDRLEDALDAADRIVTVTPDNPLALRERAELYARLDCAKAAADDYLRYLELAPDAPDASAVEARVATLRRDAPKLN